MKKIMSILMVALFLISFKGAEVKTAKVEGTIQDWDAVIQVMDQSNAPHQSVEAAKNFIIIQVNAQLADSTAKPKK
jgi:hypothetical protein